MLITGSGLPGTHSHWTPVQRLGMWSTLFYSPLRKLILLIDCCPWLPTWREREKDRDVLRRSDGLMGYHHRGLVTFGAKRQNCLGSASPHHKSTSLNGTRNALHHTSHKSWPTVSPQESRENQRMKLKHDRLKIIKSPNQRMNTLPSDDQSIMELILSALLTLLPHEERSLPRTAEYSAVLL